MIMEGATMAGTPVPEHGREHVMTGTHEKQQTAAERHEAAGVPARRARASAWTVFWLTAGTSVLYNCYHALVGDHMPWYTGVPLGVLPLAVAIGVLEFSGAWRENKTLQVAAWSVTAGAMAWSAIAINAVVHHGWAFGLIGDTAALAAMYFLLNGPTAGQAVAKVARREAELLAEIAAGQSARERQAAEHEAAATALRDRMRGELNALSARRDADVSAMREKLDGTVSALDIARQHLAESLSRADALSARLDAASGRSRPAASVPRAKRATPAASARDGDVSTELQALMELRADPNLRKPRMGGELARVLGVSPATGRRYHKEYVNPDGSLKEPLAEPLADRSS
jgi:hypothetical protein